MNLKRKHEARRKELAYQASLSYSAKQWNHCVDDFMDLFFMMRDDMQDHDLSQFEKNLFSSSFQHLLYTRRRSWRLCLETFTKEEEVDPDEQTNFKLRCIKLTKAQIESEIRLLCKD